jgi:hypothetical protein
VKKDMKEALTTGRKADITHMRTPTLVYGARACEYGDDKYCRANYLRPTTSTKEDFLRYRQYLRAAVNHINQTLDSMEYHQAEDPDLQDTEGMKKAAYAPDTDAKPGCPVGASYLPHLSHAQASLNMAITQATRCGLLPEDPGKPWAEPEKQAKLVPEGDPAHERYLRSRGPELSTPAGHHKLRRVATTEDEALRFLKRAKYYK